MLVFKGGAARVFRARGGRLGRRPRGAAPGGGPPRPGPPSGAPGFWGGGRRRPGRSAGGRGAFPWARPRGGEKKLRGGGEIRSFLFRDGAGRHRPFFGGVFPAVFPGVFFAPVKGVGEPSRAPSLRGPEAGAGARASGFLCRDKGFSVSPGARGGFPLPCFWRGGFRGGRRYGGPCSLRARGGGCRAAKGGGGTELPGARPSVLARLTGQDSGFPKRPLWSEGGGGGGGGGGGTRRQGFGKPQRRALQGLRTGKGLGTGAGRE